MARALTPNDGYAIMNLLVKQATGQSTIAKVDSSNFVSAGETVLATGFENTLNALSIVLGRTLIAVRPYQAKLRIVQALNTGIYTSRIRKISYYARENQESGDWNTDLHSKNLYNGNDNGASGTGTASAVGSQWVQNKPVAVELNFAGQTVCETSHTVYQNQMAVAFSSPEEFAAFVSGIMVEKQNDIESTKEAFNRMTTLNFMAGVYDLAQSGSVVNLTAAYNARYGTAYTSEQLRTTYLKSFLEFFVSVFKITSDYMTERSSMYHWSPSKTVDGVTYSNILRHTPYADQRVVLYSPLFTEATANVLPEIFNPEYLDIGTQYEGVNYWQSIKSPAAIHITPAIPDTANPAAQKVGADVDLPYVVGMIYDKDAILTDFQFDSATNTPLEARKRYYNIFWHWSKNAINDFTENAVLFYMADPATP